MKKSALKKMIAGSAEYVVAHGTIQKSKGKNFAATFNGIRNPKKAFTFAVSELMARKFMCFDAISTAERLTGNPCSGNDLTVISALILQRLKSCALESTMKKMNDTAFSNTLPNYLRIIKEEGFEVLLALPFSDENGRREELYVCFHKADGILLVFDTYRGDDVNSGHFYYNWRPNEGYVGSNFHVTSSGGYRKAGEELLWSGNHDCREALRLHIRDLRKHGEFVTPWVWRPFLWLLHYMDTKDANYNYEAINDERLAMLPAEIVQLLGVAN